MQPVRAAVLVIAWGCSYSPARTEVTGDAGPSDGPDEEFACTSWPTSYFDACMLPVPDGPLTLGGGEYIYDTDAGTLTDPASQLVPHATAVIDRATTDLRVISTAGFEVQAGTTLRAIGSLPLGIASTTRIQVAGAIDVSGRGIEAGAGGRATCGGVVGASTTAGAAGGGGGGFGGAGGRGGDGNSNGTISIGGMAGGTEPVPADITGGCIGGDGGAGDDPGGVAGAPGGGLVLAAFEEIAIDGIVRANGGGGRGAPAANGGDAGGGGGGSGGMIAIETMNFVVAGTVVANGGGGGEGSESGNPGNPGGDGLDAVSLAPGGTGGTTCGADGAAGGARDVLGGASPTEVLACGGGGGGGGAGHIVFRIALLIGGGVVSPAAIP